MKRSAAVLILLLLLGIPPLAYRLLRADETKAAEQAALQAASALYEGIRTETLPNGLRVYMKPVPSAPTVTTMVAYKVGSSDEDLNATGLSHYLEHLMFKGTEKIMPGDIDRLTLRNGGHNNAYTDTDYTIYHFDFAADRWQDALKVEADRMRNLRIDDKHEFEQEKGAVISELERDEDEPWDLEQKFILPQLFGKTNPYGHPVIGEREHVRGATADIIKAHYDKWYHPNNAALVIVGGFDPEQALTKIKELFGPIPKTQLPERKPVPEVAHKRPARLEIESKFEVPRLLVGFNGVRSGDPDFYALEVAQGILSGGKTARLYKKFVEGEEIASQISANDIAGRYPGWFAVQMELLKGKDRDKAENQLVQEIERLRNEPVSAAELKRVKQTLLAGTIFAREGVHGLADSIAQGVTTNDLDFLKNFLPNILKVTAADVQRVAKKYLDPEQRVTVWSVPAKAEKKEERGSRIEDRGSLSSIFNPRSSILRVQRNQRGAEAGATSQYSLKDAQKVVLPNGLTLLLFENHRLPIVVAEASVRHVGLHEPADKAGVATLMGSLLDEGTAKHSGQQIAELIENVGGNLALSAGGGSVQVLSPYRKLGLELLFECLSQATFPKEAFAREQAKMLSQIDEAEQQPEVRARNVYRESVYGKHPLGRPRYGKRATVEPLTPADCIAFYKKMFVPNNTVVAIVGDFDSKEVIDEATRLSLGWQKGDVGNPDLPAVNKPKDFVQKIVTMPAAAQLHFYLGHVGIRRDNPDYYKLLVMDYVLGTGPGFTDRLSSRLRDREGLAYTVNANITNSAGEEPGLFTCYIGTPPKNFAKVKGMFLEELNRIRAEKPMAEEVEDAKQYLLGSLAFELTTNRQIADKLLYAERYKLGFGYLDDYRKAVAAVTPEDVQEVAKKHLDPQHMVLVAAGALDDQGKPLEKLPGPKK
jgi:zinc protease